MLYRYVANKPVADFYCKSCTSDFELKSYESKTANVKRKITDGAFHTMLERITSLNNPHLFVMSYACMKVNNLMLIPKFFYAKYHRTASSIERYGSSRRLDWV